MKKNLTQDKLEKALLHDNPRITKVAYAPGVEEAMARIGIQMGNYKPSIATRMRWKALKIIEWPSDTLDNIKAFIQRGRRGYADKDCWGVDWYLSDVIPGMLEVMISDTKGGGNSYPGEGWGPEANSIKNWHKTIRKIAQGFKARNKLGEFDYKNDVERKKLEVEKEEGMKLFVKYFDHLWD